MPSPSEPSAHPHDLVWDDADPTGGRWWISRARDTAGGTPRDFFIAEDDMTDALLGLMRVPPQSHYTVLAAAFLERFDSRASAAASLKGDIAAALNQTPEVGAVRRALLLWRVVRTATVLRKNLPFVLLGLGAGALLGLALAFFAGWTGFVGWPIVAAGVVLGAAAGVLLKIAVEAYRAKAVAGPWGRFALIMLGALAGAGVTVVGALMAFWH